MHFKQPVISLVGSQAGYLESWLLLHFFTNVLQKWRSVDKGSQNLKAVKREDVKFVYSRERILFDSWNYL